MKGIQFVIDEKGKKKAVLIDLSEWESYGKISMMSLYPIPRKTSQRLIGRT